MTKKNLTEAQLAAIQYLALPKRGGLTYEQVAEEVGVSAVTLYKWRQQDYFVEELKKTIVRAIIDRLPEVMEAIPDIIIKQGNAAMFRTLLQAHGLLRNKVEVQSQTGEQVKSDIDEMKAQIEAFRKERGSAKTTAI